jgi:membrane-associated phospholipid phosphatase
MRSQTLAQLKVAVTMRRCTHAVRVLTHRPCTDRNESRINPRSAGCTHARALMTAHVSARLALVLTAWGVASVARAQPPTYSACADRSAPSIGRVVTNTLASFGRLPTATNAAWLAAGGAAALAAHPADDPLARRLPASQRVDDIFGAGGVIGGAAVQLGTSVGVYAIGRASKSGCASAIGADVLRAQLVAETLTLGLQYSVRRERPDHGSGFAFPSGHASVTFATAAVLQQFGWKAALPAYALASYVAAQRVEANHHYLSDVIFGAAVGIVSARASNATTKHSFVMVPSVGPGQAGIAFVRIE